MTKSIEQEGKNIIPPSFATTTPPSYPASDYTGFIFQAIMEMQNTIGQLTRAITELTDQSKKQGDKLDKISHKVFAAEVIVSIGASILVVIGGLAYHLFGKIWDTIIPLIQIKPHP